jgi:hypothetical protein
VGPVTHPSDGSVNVVHLKENVNVNDGLDCFEKIETYLLATYTSNLSSKFGLLVHLLTV